jgi:hypothetical protein
MAFKTFNAYIFNSGQATASFPATGQTFTPTSRDLLKNIAGTMIEGGWTLLSGTGEGTSAVYLLKTTGDTGSDSLAAELRWDAYGRNIQIRIAPDGTSGGLTNAPATWNYSGDGGYQNWPITNTTDLATNQARSVTAWVWANKESVSFITDEPVSGFKCGGGPFGIGKRWTGTTPTNAPNTNAAADLTILYQALPSLHWHGANQQAYFDEANWATPGSYVNVPTPTTNEQYVINTTTPNDYIYPRLFIACVRVYKNYQDDAAGTWILNYLSNGAEWDGNNNNTDSGTAMSGKFDRQPAMRRSCLGTDGNYHAERSAIYQISGTDLNNITDGKKRGWIDGVANIGFNSLADDSVVTLGSETYRKVKVNVGFWSRINPNGHAIRAS